MKGKRLYELITSLSKSERRQLNYKCSSSNDKRHDYLKRCLDVDSIDDFQKQLQKIKSKFSHLNSKKQNESLNRIIYFSRQEIENVKMLHYLNENGKERNRVLAEISYSEEQYGLFDYYSDKIKKDNNNQPDLVTDLRRISWEINLRLRIQTKEDYKKLKNLLIRKSSVLDDLYHVELGQYYYLLSSICMDNSLLFDELKANFPSNEKINRIIKDVRSSSIAGIFKVSEARFNFYNLDQLQKQIAEAEELFRKGEGDEDDKDKGKRLLRVTIFLKMLMGMQYGLPLESLREWSQEGFELQEKFNIHETMVYFFHLMFVILDEDYEEYNRISEARNSRYFNNQNRFYIHFLKGLTLHMEGKPNEALDFLKDLRHNDSHYIAMWSRLLEIRIHYDLENFDLLESLLAKMKRYLDNNSHKQFMWDSCFRVYKFFKQAIRNIEKPKPIEDNHFKLFKVITKI